MSRLDDIDAASESVRKDGTARVTLNELKHRIENVEYLTREHLTICIVKVDNGFYLVGKSAPLDPENFNEAYGKELAYDDAVHQLWPLLAFRRLDE